MKLYKKADVDTHTLLMIIVLLVFALVFAIVIWKSEGPMSVYLHKIFDWV